MTAILNARQTVPAPTRTARRFGLLSAVSVVDGGDFHWVLGGITADGEECSKPLSGQIVCGPSDAKVARSWYSNIDGNPWLGYMYETCETVGRYSESADKLKARYAAVESSAVERGFQENVLTGATSIGTYDSVALAIGALEGFAAQEYGGQITLHLPFMVAEEASHAGMFERVGDHLETAAGNVVSIGNYEPTLGGNSPSTPWLYATGSVNLYRSPLIENGPVLGVGGPANSTMTNDYYALIERAYVAVVDCFMASAKAKTCGCGSGGGSGGGPTPATLSPGDTIDLSAVATNCGEALDYVNGSGFPASPTTAWTSDGSQIVNAPGLGGCSLFWDGTAWAIYTPPT